MANKRLKQPVTVAAIEFDALIDEQKTLNATIPAYPVEDGFPISDTIILEPIGIQMTLFVSNTPVTWLHRHGSAADRVNRICSDIENMWFDKKLVKIVTNDAIYTDMGITSISIKKSKEVGYAREISLQAQKVFVTSKKTVSIPSYILQSGTSEASAGKASTSNSSNKSGDSEDDAKKKQSILYGVASGLGFL